MDEIRFGGAAPHPGGATAEKGAASLPLNNQEFHQRYAEALARRPTWLKVLQQAADQLRSTPEGRTAYGDPERGATLPQAWNMQFAVSGHFNFCLLARGRPATPPDDIPEVVLIAATGLTTVRCNKAISGNSFVCARSSGAQRGSGRWWSCSPAGSSRRSSCGSGSTRRRGCTAGPLRCGAAGWWGRHTGSTRWPSISR